MANPPEKRRLPKDITERSDHDIMEHVFGKRVMKIVDKEVKEHSENAENLPMEEK